MEVEQVVVRLVADTTQYFASLDYAGARLLGYSAGLVTGIAKHGVQMAATFEKNSVAVRTMVGDFEEGNKLLADITKLAIETPFSSDELVGVTKQLKAFGLETTDIIPTLTALGNVSAGTGTDINRIALAFGQVKVAGKLMGTELRQFVDAGVPLMEYLGKVMNKPTESIRTLTEQGRVGFQQVVEAFNMMNAEGGKFAGLMDTISKTTIGGRWQAFRETLDVASRNFALAAIEGLGMKDALEGAVKSMGDLNDKQTKTVAAFENVRAVINGVWMMLRKLWEVASAVGKEVAGWVEENKNLVKYVLLVVGTFWTLYAVVKTVTIALLAVRGVIVGLYALSGLMPLISSFASLFGVITSIIAAVAPIFTILAPAVVIITAIVYYLNKLGTFQFMGTAFSEGVTALGELREAFKGIVEALQSGDLETAWNLITTSFQYAWRVMILTLQGEWDAFVQGLQDSIGRKLTKQLNPSFVANVDKSKEEELRREQNILAAQSQYRLSNQTATDLIRFQELALEAMNKQVELEQALKVYNQVIGGEEKRPMEDIARVNAQYKKDIQELLEMRKKYDKEVQRLIGVGGSEKEEAAIKRRKDGMVNDPTLVRLKGDIDRISKAAEEKRAEMSKGVVDPAAPLSQMAVPYGISGQARDVMNKLEKELEKGVGAWDHFTKQIALINEAYWGPSKGKEKFGAALGGFGMAGRTGPMGDAAYLLGLFQSEQELAKGLEKTPRTAPASLFGSTAAQDTINANLNQQSSTVEQDVLNTLIESKIVQQQQRDYQKEVADAMKKFIADGTLKKLEINGN